MPLTSCVFTTEEVSLLAGVTERQLQFWDEERVLSPQSKKGHRRVYSLDQAICASVIGHLRRRGMSLQRLRRLGPKFLRSNFAWREPYLVTDAARVFEFAADADSLIARLKAMKHGVFLIAIAEHRAPFLAHAAQSQTTTA